MQTLLGKIFGCTNGDLERVSRQACFSGKRIRSEHCSIVQNPPSSDRMAHLQLVVIDTLCYGLSSSGLGATCASYIFE
jgi:hypothetical protein